MPAAKPKKPAAAKLAAKSDEKAPLLNGIPLRRRSIWTVDVDSPQFRAARKRDAQALKQDPGERDSKQFLDAVLAEKDVQKWWN